MGHREDLLGGAKRCLLQKGFLRTTARDIVKESGTNLASIGYHYGSKEALLAQAYLDLVAETSDAFEGPGSGGVTAGPGSLERFRQVWVNIIGTMREPGSVWRLSIEIAAMGDQLPVVRDHLAQQQREAERDLVSLFMGIPADQVTDDVLNTAGRFYTALMSGLILQWQFDPERAPDADALTEGLRRVIEGMGRN
ncbi:TetR/AcrR family transcriptional regulator [Streptomyces thermodiastaticus]|uniref:TetR/AcrR family transcriptional regulator n=1 Tax=Streptomyces thermodiastaticus TaxID=44061 RepID=UPI001671967C|nr:TetR/AcrR family transcriptional regulator [Streptomyces thermodiastaticus]MCE7552563.1 TetR/AcrR family transcriptional regulator [Streptomyces thermodiastaticus]GHF87425.1 TetR family transcriptional regulator [Streptomyces thermodiastaticus]